MSQEEWSLRNKTAVWAAYRKRVQGNKFRVTQEGENYVWVHWEEREKACNCISISGESQGRSSQALKLPNFVFETLLFFLLTHLTIPIPCLSNMPPNRMVDMTDMARLSEQKQNLQRLPFCESHTLSLIPITVAVSCSCGWTSCTNGLLTGCIWGANQSPLMGGAVAILAPRQCTCLIWQGLTSSWPAPRERGGFKLFYLSRSSHLPSGPLTPAP